MLSTNTNNHAGTGHTAMDASDRNGTNCLPSVQVGDLNLIVDAAETDWFEASLSTDIGRFAIAVYWSPGVAGNTSDDITVEVFETGTQDMPVVAATSAADLSGVVSDPEVLWSAIGAAVTAITAITSR
jgi:hypothetical protein